MVLLCLTSLLIGAGCGRSSEMNGRGTTARVTETVGEAGTSVTWVARYVLRGTVERSRQATGTLVVDSLPSTAPRQIAAAERVRRMYPTYDGPLYVAQLVLAAEQDTTGAELTCAHGPAEPPPLVCVPETPLAGLEHASLVVEPDGDATLTGSHGEGVRVEYARLRWTSEARSRMPPNHADSWRS